MSASRRGARNASVPTKRKAVRKRRQAGEADARALQAALDALPVGFALFDADGRLAAWNARLGGLKLFPKRLLKKGTALGAFRAYDKALSTRVSRPREVELRKGVVLRASSGRVAAGQLLVTYEDITAQKRAESALGHARAEANDAIERQSATAEILEVMAGAPSDVTPVFDAIARNAARLLAPASIGLSIIDGNLLKLGAVAGPLFADGTSWREAAGKFYPTPFDPAVSVAARAIVDGSVLEIPDTEAKGTPPRVRALYRAGGARSSTQIPLILGGQGIGSLGIAHPQPGFRLSDKQLELMKAFAAQAAIAIENVRLFNETREALERQTATAEILRVISRSPTDIQPVLDAVAESAARLCEAADCSIFRLDGDRLVLSAHHGSINTPGSIGAFSIPLSQKSVAGRTVLESRTIHVADIHAAADEYPKTIEVTRSMGFGTMLSVPLIRDGLAIGVIQLPRTEVRPFTDRQIALLETFADQAVIAIENVRLFNETREALERQTSTAEILKVISQSPDDLTPVFGAILDRATRLCEAQLGVVFTYDGEAFDMVVERGLDPQRADEIKKVLHENRVPGPQTAIGTLLSTRRLVHVLDVRDTDGYRTGDPLRVSTADLIGARTLLAVPLLRDSTVLGAVVIYRREVRPFADQQLALLQTFADQAVIAIENVRLFNETREALERQTATAEVLQAISSSIADAAPVFERILDGTERLIASETTGIFLIPGDGQAHCAALRGPGAANIAALYPRPLEETSAPIVLDKRRQVCYPNALHGSDVPLSVRQSASQSRNFSLALTPLLWEENVIGVLSVMRPPNVTFDEKELGLLRTFADQAVIAIQNARLFNETKEALERQTATAEVLQTISRSISDATPVFERIVESTGRLIACERTGIFLVPGDGQVHCAAIRGFSVDTASIAALYPRPLEETPAAPIIESRRQICYPDALHGADVPLSVRQIASQTRNFSLASTPLLWEENVIGVLSVTRPPNVTFNETELSLLRTFADQAVIAIQNARLFNETKEALERQTATAEILKVISESPTDVQPVFDAITRSAAHLFPSCITGILMREGDQVTLNGLSGPTQVDQEAMARTFPLPFDPDKSLVARAIVSRQPLQIWDSEAPEAPESAKQAGRAIGFRSLTTAPLVREGVGIGAISVANPNAEFRLSDKQIALLQTFADQAVIAIENVRLFNETKEALERQTATAEILKVIAASPADVQPVFDAIAKNCGNLFPGSLVLLWLIEDGVLRARAITGAGDLQLLGDRLPIDRGSAIGTCVVESRMIHLPDLEKALDMHPRIRQLGLKWGHRSGIYAPLMREARAIGAIAVLRPAIGAFDDEEVALLNTFANQAVIAIENVRLFNETKEALERQTATGEILKVISESPTDTQPVFDAIAQSAARLFDCGVGINILRDNKIHLAAGTNVDEDQAQRVRSLYPFPHDPKRVIASRAIAMREIVEVMDTQAPDAPEIIKAVGRSGNFRSVTQVPLVREGVGIGTIALTSDQPGVRLNDKQRALLKTFADQAVIAIENVRLFNETKEALERQTATAEILKVISESPTDAQPVFDAIAKSAQKLLSDAEVGIALVRGDRVELVAAAGLREDRLNALRTTFPRPLDLESSVNQTAVHGETIHYPDCQAHHVPAYTRNAASLAGVAAMLGVPLLREGKPIGGVFISKTTLGAFGEKQIELLRTFADQAVIAIENVRLFNELQSRTEALTRSVGQLTALGEVSQTISSTLDLEKVLPTIVSRAVQLTGLDGGAVYEYDEASETFALRAGENVRQEILELNRSAPIRIGDGAVGRAAATRQPVQVPDIAAANARQTRGRDVLLQIGARALLAVPLVREDHVLGALAVIRNTPGEFAPEVIALLETFATQSAIAIQNARLFREIEDKSHQLEQASRHKSQFLASMSHELRTPLNAILGFNELILGGVYGELADDMRPPLEQMQSSGKHLLSLINNVLDLAKIEANKMELALADYSVHDAVRMVHSTLQSLAADKGLEFVVTAPDDLPLAHGDGGRLSQCLINLAGNAIKFTKQGRVEIRVTCKDETLRFSVADTGIGIPPDKIGSLFTEFKQTDATVASEYGGTGLGLSISKKFIEMHGGRIWVESTPGEGSTFIFEVPLRVTAGGPA